MPLRRHLAGLAALTGLLAAPAVLGGPPAGAGSRGPASQRPPAAKDAPTHARLTAWASLSADLRAPGPPSGAQATPANGRSGPFPGQVIPGFSAVVQGPGDSFWAMPDNGFGSKGNSADFLLRIYRVTPRFETARGGPADIRLDGFIALRDPDRKVPFPIVNSSTTDRLLTGGDFDVESLVRADDGTFWIGEEFGPYLLHVSADGVVLDAPVPFVDGRSPQSPDLAPGEAPRVPASRGFEALARSADGRYLYPIVEGALTDETQPRRRWIHQFDTTTGAYTGTRWAYATDLDGNVIGDAFVRPDGTLIVLERDNLDGPESVTKKLYTVDLDEVGPDDYLRKELLADLLFVHNPRHIGPGAEQGYGYGDPFSFPMQSVETVVQLRDGRLLVANDNNYPGNDARRPGTPDDTELFTIELDRTSRAAGQRRWDPLVVGHRGASGYRPEHTLAAYELAIRQCADYIEPDLVSTKDGVLVARHENEIGGTTDVADRPEFAGRKATKMIDGSPVTGWFTEDLTLAELKTLRATERIPATRPGNTAFDGLFEVPTLQEVIDLARRHLTCDGNPVGIYPETKHPTYFDLIGLSMEEPLVEALHANGYTGRRAPVIIQSFEVANLKALRTMTDLPIAQLVNCSGRPYDFVVAGDPRTYADLVTTEGIAEIASYATGIGACKDVLIPRDAAGRLTAPTPVIDLAHRRGLAVHGWTFRAENTFLPTDLRSSDVPSEQGDVEAEITAFLRAGMDGFFTDQPDRGVAATHAYDGRPGRQLPPGRR